jgi:exodeoxyribonuclease V alpha subunit
MSTLAGSIERIVFQNPEGGFTVARVAASDRSKKSRHCLATIVGLLPALRPGELVTLEGGGNDHPKHGAAFWVKRCNVTLPAEQSAIRKYLGSGWIRGLGVAKAIIEHFSAETIRVLAEAKVMLPSPDSCRPVICGRGR